MVRTEGTRLGLADTAASEPHATSALADERRSVQRRRSQDDPAPRGDGRRPTEDDGEAHDDPTQGDREARDGQAQDREANHGEAWRPQDHSSPKEHWALDGEAHDAPLFDPQEAPLG